MSGCSPPKFTRGLSSKAEPQPVVFEPDDRAIPTGLLDKDGNELCRIEEMEPIGFVRLDA